jgi:hypothetical protein
LTIVWKRSLPYLLAGNRSIKCSCNVRNELNGERGGEDIVYSMPDHEPYMPRPFPTGSWNIGKPEPRVNKYLAPYFIPTDARQVLPVWSILDGAYDAPTKQTVSDWGYGLHYSESMTTLGCIRIHSREDLLWLVDKLTHETKNTILVTD